MTLETAKRIIEEGLPNKEAEAVVRGGMTICEHTEDGRRNYIWIKVLPTESDNESSINLALKAHRDKNKMIANLVKSDSTIQVKVIAKQEVRQEPIVSSKINPKNQNKFSPVFGLYAFIKRKFNEFVRIIDGLVEE